MAEKHEEEGEGREEGHAPLKTSLNSPGGASRMNSDTIATRSESERSAIAALSPALVPVS